MTASHFLDVIMGCVLFYFINEIQDHIWTFLLIILLLSPFPNDQTYQDREIISSFWSVSTNPIFGLVACLLICSSIKMDPGQMAVWFYYFLVPCHTGANTERLGCGVQFWRRCQLKVELSLICFSLSGSRHAQPCPVPLYFPLLEIIFAWQWHMGGKNINVVVFRWEKKRFVFSKA